MDEIKLKAQKIIDVWNSKNLETISELYKGDTVFFDPLLGVEIKGDNILLYAKGIYESFPDLKFVVKDITTSVDIAMVEWSQNGTNTGEILGKSATGRYVEIPAVSVFRFSGDKLTSHYDYWDMKKFLSDLFK